MWLLTDSQQPIASLGQTNHTKEGSGFLNERTIRILEFPKIVAKVEALATSNYGKELVRELVPLTDPALIRQAQQITSEMARLLEENDRIPLGGIFDIRDSLKRAAIGSVLSPQELLEVASTLRASRLMKDYLTGRTASAEHLSEWGGRLGSFPMIERELERCIGPNGEVLDGASPKLHQLRSQMKVLQNRVREKLDSLIHNSDNSKYLQDQIVTVRNERYVIPVKQEYRSFFPGIVHDHSASGATLFIEPLAVVELNNQLAMVESQEAEEVNRILAELTGKIQGVKETVLVSVNILARVDLAYAKARYSLEIHGSEPELNTDSIVELRSARHPLIPGKVVPISLTLGRDYDTLVITGPNTGGKTVTLKTVGLLTLMAQSGLHVPAGSGSRLAVFSEIFCDIGDEQSIEQSLSTFSSHLTQIIRILEAVRGRDCLVLLDELGAGTDPSEGAALAMSILTHLHRLEARAIATTHYSELKAFAYNTPGIENASVEFDVETLKPTYHLLIGLPGSSQAFEIALKLGMPEHLIAESRKYISADTARMEEILKEIETDRRKAREDRIRSEEALVKGETLKKRYETEWSRFKEQKDALIREAKAEAREILLEARRDSENLLRRIREASKEELVGIVNESRTRINAELERLEEKPVAPVRRNIPKPGSVKVGSKVRAVSVNQIGTVLEINNETVLVQLGILKATLPLSDIELLDETKVKLQTPLKKTGISGLETAARISPEINLLGLIVDDALYQLEKYLDQAILAGLPGFRVIHGKGTGALRQAVQKYLRDNPVVKSVAFAEQNEGGLGATVVELKKN
jgi:DNA mismatch repair protein MutS2